MLRLFFFASILLSALVFRAQDTCTGLSISDVFIHPIDQNLLVIQSESSGEEPYNYPGFRIYHEGSLMGEEQVVYFGLAGTNYHFVELLAPIEESANYAFNLELWTSFYSDLTCELDWSGTPYDPSACFEGVLSVMLSGTGSEELMIEMWDENGTSFIEITETLDLVTPTFAESFCLERACYGISVVPTDGVMDVNVIVNFATNYYTWYNQLVPAGAASFDYEMSIWNGCDLSTEEHVQSRVYFYPNPVKVGEQINHSFLPAGAKIRCFTINGEELDSRINGQPMSFPSAGLYFVRVEWQDGRRSTHKIVVE